MNSSRSDTHRRRQFAQERHHALRGDAAGFRVFRRDVFDRHIEQCGIGDDFDVMRVADYARIGPHSR